MAKLTKNQFFEGLKIVFKELSFYRKDIFILSIFGIFSSITSVFIPYLSGRIIDSFITPAVFFKDYFWAAEAAFYFIFGWAIASLLSDFLGWLGDIRRNKLMVFIEADYLIKSFSSVLNLPLSFFKKHKAGKIASQIERAGDQLSALATRVILNLAPQFLTFIMAIIVMFFIKIVLILIILSAVIIYLLILIFITPQLAVLISKSQQAYNQAYGDDNEMLLNIVTVKQATAEHYEQTKLFKNFRLKAAEYWIKWNNNFSTVGFYQSLLVSGSQFLVFLLSLYFVRKNLMTVGELVMFISYIYMLFRPLMFLGSNWNVVNNGLIAVLKARKILEEAKENYEPQDQIIIDKINGNVEFRNISFSYGRKQGDILENINCQIKAGETIALVGESGVGKTTFIDLISLYLKPRKGKILIDGHNIENFNLKFLRSQIAVVPQEIILFNDTVKNNIKYGSFGASDKKVMEAAQKAHAHDFIEKFPKKYNQMVGERGIKLSSGQKQRIAIARAILRNPNILILDEPTSALDALSEKYVTEALEELMKDRTTFIVAHRLATVRKADRIFVFSNGKIVEEGNHENLIKIENGIYRRLYELQKL